MAVAASSFFPAEALANVSAADLIRHGMPPDLADFAARVSASEGTWTSVNQYGCAGAFQFCPPTLAEYYSGTRDQFLADPRAQVDAYRRYMDRQWSLATRHGYDSLIGQQVCYGGTCTIITASSILKACQFGCSLNGALWNYYQTGDCDQGRDGNGVSVCRYMIDGVGLNVAAVTGAEEDGVVSVASVVAGMCLQVPVMSQQGELVTSPFGVDRTGRSGASNGYHLGLDLINGVGRDDPILSGVPGRVVMARNDDTNSVFVETPDGAMRVGYLHGGAINVRVGDEVQPDTQVVTMGDKGSPGAVHLHLYTSLRGDIVANLGEAAGVVWPLGEGDFWGNKNRGGLSGGDLVAAAPAPYYMVNPETYLHHRIPFQKALLDSEHYRQQGLVRPDGLTLEPTCAPAPEFYARGGFRSMNYGSTSNGGMAESGAALATNPQTVVNMATSQGRDAMIQYSISAIGETTRAANHGQSQRATAAMWAGMVLGVQ
ncbi:MAG: peptidoglycan DD-metalloendopeptidase family protein [Paracoccus sp. (in: a-proteobacteria)]|uniref:M23 family metallopeptidase n=1 Tax=Paracoccus sp. TaxID=267 RepID=UPI0026DFC71E|nr:peptidoglycan DD-metalloendopeptidase family protein [Paracoccus sp. (in: a-proteobacteria)]MDO5631622.1 peptidoglycan DD-metalloendopeptidase family protein [Paracoccus sp. (in: a-proteobacteria)]